MDKQLLLRLQILEEAKEIDSAIKEAIMKFSNAFENKFDIKLTEENSSMLITHLAMALARVKKNEPVNEMDETTFNEIKQQPIFNELPAMYEILEEELGINLPQSEKGFIALHACTVMLNK